ncbi:MAG: hypothetical protein WCB11_21835 [Terriglobales bacterium]
MLDIIDAINTIESVSTDSATETAELQIERGDEIASLWSAHQNAKIAARATTEELRALRAKLGEQLSEMKQVLAQPGRSGQWSSFLRERGIPRATADRLVARHERFLSPESNLLSEANSEPTEEEVETLFKSILPRLQRILKTPRSIYRFVSLLTSRYECGEATDRGIMVLAPAALTICPESSDEGCFGEPEVCAAAVVGADEQAI